MKHLFVIVLFVTSGMAFHDVRSETLPDGADLYIKAARSGAGNHTLLHSLSYVAEQTYRLSTLSEEEIEKKAAAQEEYIRSIVKRAPNAHMWLDGTREAVHKHYYELQNSVLSRFTVKYKAPSFSRKLLLLQIEHQGQDSKKWEVDMRVIEASTASRETPHEGVVWFQKNRSAHIESMGSNTETLLNFGRLQGPSVALIQLLLFQDADVEKYEFSEKNIAKFKDERQKQIQSGNAKTLITMGIVVYDGSAKAYIVESSIGSQVIERYWIDVNRGYVCPLLQYYDEKGKLLSEYKSENYFMHEKSGLWFPQQYKETVTKEDGKQEFKEYRIDKASLDANFPITDEEFAIEIPEYADVIDMRKTIKTTRYMATSTGVLSLGKDGLNLQKMDWLASMNVPAKSPFRYTFLQVALLTFGIILILFSLHNRFVLKKK